METSNLLRHGMSRQRNEGPACASCILNLPQRRVLFGCGKNRRSIAPADHAYVHTSPPYIKKHVHRHATVSESLGLGWPLLSWGLGMGSCRASGGQCGQRRRAATRARPTSPETTEADPRRGLEFQTCFCRDMHIVTRTNLLVEQCRKLANLLQDESEGHVLELGDCKA